MATVMLASPGSGNRPMMSVGAAGGAEPAMQRVAQA